MRITHVDIGGCEGCSFVLIRAMKKLQGIEFKSRLLGKFEIENEEMIIVSGGSMPKFRKS